MGFVDDNENSLVKIGEKEYSLEELETMSDKYNKVLEIEKDHGDVSNFKSIIGKNAQEIGDLKKQLKQLEEERNKNKVETIEDKELEIVAERLMPVLKSKFNLMTTDEYQSNRETERLLTKVNKLERKIDGSDGRPKFDTVRVLTHMRDNGFKDPMKAYKDLNEPDLEKWTVEQLSKKKFKGMPTLETRTTNREPVAEKVTKENLLDRIKENLYKSDN